MSNEQNEFDTNIENKNRLKTEMMEQFVSKRGEKKQQNKIKRNVFTDTSEGIIYILLDKL